MSAFRFIEAERARHSIPKLCRMLGVSRSGYYVWRSRTPSERTRLDAVLSEKIETIHRNSRATYGAPRIHDELRALGIRCGKKRIARLMLRGSSRRWPGRLGLRQRPRRVVRRYAQDGVDLPSPVAHPAGGQDGDLRVPRGLLQPKEGHSSLGHLSPAEFEEVKLTEAAA